jgi:hypothetical protein
MQIHQPSDIICGMIIGLFAGLIAYRSSYASLLDFRVNHIPLPPASAHIRFGGGAVTNKAAAHSNRGMSSSGASSSESYSNGSSGDRQPCTGHLGDRLVTLDWWRKPTEQVEMETRKWLTSAASLRATAVELKDANLQPIQTMTEVTPHDGVHVRRQSDRYMMMGALEDGVGST